MRRPFCRYRIVEGWARSLLWILGIFHFLGGNIMNIPRVLVDAVIRRPARIRMCGLTLLGLSLFTLSPVFAPINAYAVPITEAFTFIVPPLPGRKISPGGWGGLFVSFNILIDKATFSIDPVLDSCVVELPLGLCEEGTFSSFPVRRFAWECRNRHELKPAAHKGLIVKLVVEFDSNRTPPTLELLKDMPNDPDPKNTFWFQKHEIHPDNTFRFFKGLRDEGNPKLAAFAPEPGTLSLVLGAL